MGKKKEVVPVITPDDVAKADAEATAHAEKSFQALAEQPAKPKKGK